MSAGTVRGVVWILLATFVVGVSPTLGGIVINGGIAYRSLNVGESPTMSNPPGTYVQNVDYEGYDTILRPNGRTDFTNGWSSASWDANAFGGINGHFSGGGSSRQGPNGAHGATGWIWGQGQAGVSATFTLDQSYHYTATNTTRDRTGVHAGKGYKRAGTHTVSGLTVGNQPGFFFDMTLVPGVLPTAEQLLKDSVHITVQGGTIRAEFRPANGDSPAAAAEALGFKEFNFVQSITHVPSHWTGTLVQKELVNVPFTGTPVMGPFVDPSPIPGYVYRFSTPHYPFGRMWFDTETPSDDEPYYYNVGAERNGREKNGMLVLCLNPPPAA